MMFFDKLPARNVKYSFKITVVLPNLDEKVFEYEGESYESFLVKAREAHAAIELVYKITEQRDVTEF